MTDTIGADTAKAATFARTDDPETMEQVYRIHAKEAVEKVWPGGTVTIGPGGNTHIEVSNRMRTYYGRAIYARTYRPNDEYAVRYEDYDHLEPTDSKFVVIRLNSDLPDMKGTYGALETVRHELIHAWQFLHPNGETGHGPTFKQWLDDMDVDW